MRIGFVDIETDQLEATEIVLVELEVLDMDNGKEERYSLADTAIQFIKPKQNFNVDLLVWHNGVGFDEQHLRKLGHWEFDGLQIIDTLVLSRMLCPERRNHSLKSWGDDLGFPKGEFNWCAWDRTVTPELVTYCQQDVAVTRRLFFHLNEKMVISGINWNASHDFEYEVQQSVDNQLPFHFDTAKADSNIKMFTESMENIEDEVYHLLPEVPLPKSKLHYPPKKQFKLDGTPSALAEKYFPDLHKHEYIYSFSHPDGSRKPLPWHTPLITHEKATFKSTAKLKDYLVNRGWVPTEYNMKKDAAGKAVRGSPKLYNESGEVDPGLIRLGISWVPALQQWLTLRSRLNVLKGLREKAIDIGLYSVIRTPAIACGARTARMIHRDVVNIPRVTSLYGKEMREVFTCGATERLVGWDASALEACMEAHEVWDVDASYALSLVDGTLHDRNAAALGVSRDVAKTFKYACTYGARPQKLAKTLGITVHEAQKLFDIFWEESWSLAKVRDRYIAEWKSVGSIPGIDGRRLYPKYEHSVLNTRLQNSGATVMKKALLIAERNIHKISPSAGRVIAYHDEEQWRCREEIADEVGQLGVDSITQAGLQLGIKPALTGEYKIGHSWAETH
jgi:hypothetical protein